MARYSKGNDFTPVITAAQTLINKCLLNDDSIFSNNRLWTTDNIEDVHSAFVNHPDEGDDSFSVKLRGQLKNAKPEGRRLMAEIIWGLLLFPSNIKIQTKRQQVCEVWDQSGETLIPEHEMLQDQVLAGIGSGGTAYNNLRWREISFFLALLRDVKRRSVDERHSILNNYDRFIDWIDGVPRDGQRQFPHMLRYFAFPDKVERMSSNRERRAVLESFGVVIKNESKKWTDKQLDDALFKLRQKLEAEYPNDPLLDFYEPPLIDRWRPDTGQEHKMKFWIEKTIVKDRPDRIRGDHMLGKALWSPQQAVGGQDYYRQMRELEPGDVVFHFIDNEKFVGYSIVSSKAEDSFIGIAGTEWAGRPAYRVALKTYTEIEPPIHRGEFLGKTPYEESLRDLLRSEKGLFFNRELNLNQGRYLTQAPIKFIQILIDIYERKTGKSLPGPWNSPGLSPKAPTDPIRSEEFNSTILRDAYRAISVTGFKVSEVFLRRFILSLVVKPFLILTGNSGTGKTRLAEIFTSWLNTGMIENSALVSVGADWTDSRNVLGFVNYLRGGTSTPSTPSIDTPLYQSTPILNLLISASKPENRSTPFFIILDEMNLSHVERYFSDILSAMESSRGKIALHSEGSSLPRIPGGPADVPRSLTYPDNIFIIGTVNVDETTYMFSPKVLDRANVIEFRLDGGDAEEFLNKPHSDIKKVMPAPSGVAEGFLKLAQEIRRFDESSTDAVDASDNLSQCRGIIKDLFHLLSSKHLEFGYRTMVEILRYTVLDYRLSGSKNEWKWQSAMDVQILQKILPKLHGSKRKIGPVLAGLACYCEKGNLNEARSLINDENKVESYLSSNDKRISDPLFDKSYGKLFEMIQSVRRDQFVSFIQ